MRLLPDMDASQIMLSGLESSSGDAGSGAELNETPFLRLNGVNALEIGDVQESRDGTVSATGQYEQEMAQNKTSYITGSVPFASALRVVRSILGSSEPNLETVVEETAVVSVASSEKSDEGGTGPSTSVKFVSFAPVAEFEDMGSTVDRAGGASGAATDGRNGIGHIEARRPLTVADHAAELVVSGDMQNGCTTSDFTGSRSKDAENGLLVTDKLKLMVGDKTTKEADSSRNNTYSSNVGIEQSVESKETLYPTKKAPHPDQDEELGSLDANTAQGTMTTKGGSETATKATFVSQKQEWEFSAALTNGPGCTTNAIQVTTHEGENRAGSAELQSLIATSTHAASGAEGREVQEEDRAEEGGKSGDVPNWWLAVFAGSAVMFAVLILRSTRSGQKESG